MKARTCTRCIHSSSYYERPLAAGGTITLVKCALRPEASVHVATFEAKRCPDFLPNRQLEVVA